MARPPRSPEKLARQARAKAKAAAAASYVEPGAHHYLHGFKRDHLVRLVQEAGAALVTKEAAALWAKDPSGAPGWLKAEWDRRSVRAALAEANERAQQERLLAKVVARLQRGARNFSRAEEQLVVADIAFRAWKEIQRGATVTELSSVDRAALVAAGIHA